MSKKSPKPMMPIAPTYTPTPTAAQYSQMIPPAMTGQQILSLGTRAEKDPNQIDPSLSILESINPTLSPEARQRYQDEIYDYAIRPDLALQAVQTDPNVSSSQAQLGGQIAQGRTQAYLSAEDLANQRLQQLLSRRQSWFSGAPALNQQQNAQDIGRGTTLAGLAQGSSEMQNRFNLGNFQNQASLYNMGLQNQANRANLWGGLANTGLNLAGQGIGAYFGGPAGAAVGGGIANKLGSWFGGSGGGGGGGSAGYGMTAGGGGGMTGYGMGGSGISGIPSLASYAGNKYQPFGAPQFALGNAQGF